MTLINIRNSVVQINIEAELREYDFGYNARWSPNKLVASSPFRADQAPSFFVNLAGEYAGTWADSGALDEQYSSGNFVSLIAYMRGIEYAEAEEYLLGKYGGIDSDRPSDIIRIPTPRIAEKQRYKIIENNPITQATSPYLLTRGISAEVQRLFGIGYGKTARGYTAIPWHTPEGSLATIKYRSTSGKNFFYEKGSTSVNRLVYGIDLADETAVLCEGEIDAMSFREAGISAIAVGGSRISDEQIEIIKRSKIDRLILGGDNDEQGRRLNRQAEEELRGFVELRRINYGKEKDANDVLKRRGVEALNEITAGAKPVRAITFCPV